MLSVLVLSLHDALGSPEGSVWKASATSCPDQLSGGVGKGSEVGKFAGLVHSTGDMVRDLLTVSDHACVWNGTGWAFLCDR